jgi:hypothetical protein
VLSFCTRFYALTAQHCGVIDEPDSGPLNPIAKISIKAQLANDSVNKMSTSVASFSAYQPPAYPPPTSTPDRAVPPSGVHLTRDADYLIQSFLPTTEAAPLFEIPKLPLPYCAPQLTPGFDAPFCRAYNPILESVDLPQDQLLAFIDGLNLAMTASPPLRVVNIIGMAIGFV